MEEKEGGGNEGVMGGKGRNRKKADYIHPMRC